jgi:hypothetical protein
MWGDTVDAILRSSMPHSFAYWTSILSEFDLWQQLHRNATTTAGSIAHWIEETLAAKKGKPVWMARFQCGRTQEILYCV